MEVASDASAWLVVLAITLARELYPLESNDAQKRNLSVWERGEVESGGATIFLLFGRIFIPFLEFLTWYYGVNT